MKPLEITLLLFSLPLLAFGGESLYRGVRSRQQVTVACEQFMQQPPATAWLRVTGCELDYDGAGYRESRGQIKALYFPVRPRGQVKTAPALLIVSTEDPEVLAMAQGTMGDGKEPDQEAFLVMMLRIVTALEASREVEGYARTGLVRMRSRQSLAGLNTTLDPNYVVLDLHARPDFVTPGLIAGGGLLLLMLGLLLRSRRAAAPTAADIATTPVPIPPSEPPVLARRLPGLMLLNLNPSDGPEAIERAPALGRRGEVRQKLVETLDAVRFGVDGIGKLSAPDAWLTFDLGRGEPVWTIVVEARGHASTGAVRTLAEATGWRIYMPMKGEFVEPAQLEQVTL